MMAAIVCDFCSGICPKKLRNSFDVLFRVLNVLRHWVDQHYYDFEWHYELLNTLESFLETVKGKAMKKCVESIRKAIKRRKNSGSATERNIVYEKPPPRVLWHITEKYETFDLMTVSIPCILHKVIPEKDHEISVKLRNAHTTILLSDFVLSVIMIIYSAYVDI